MDEIAQLRDENARLKAELDELRKSKGTQTIVGMNDLVIVAGADGVVRYVNSASEKHFGVARTAVIGQPLAALQSADLRGALLHNLLGELKPGAVELRREAVFRDAQQQPSKVWSIHVARTAQPGGGDQFHFLISDKSDLHRVRSALMRYISPTVADDVLAAGVDPFKARKYELSVMFADLRGFTSTSSTLQAEQVKQMIDEYLTVHIDVILDAGATVDKIVGDEIMALFGAPLAVPRHALWAVNTALKMQAAHEKLLHKWVTSGAPGCPLGIGIHSGEMVVGNIGSPRRMDYTVLGHNVNLAARLCSAAEPGEVLMSTTTFEHVRNALAETPNAIWCPVKFRKGRTLQAKGIAAPVETVVAVPQR